MTRDVHNFDSPTKEGESLAKCPARRLRKSQIPMNTSESINTTHAMMRTVTQVRTSDRGLVALTETGVGDIPFDWIDVAVVAAGTTESLKDADALRTAEGVVIDGTIV